MPHSDWITVYTKDGLEYEGRLRSYGFGESKREIVVDKPKLIMRDNTGSAITETLCGQEMIFTEGDALRIAALSTGEAMQPVATETEEDLTRTESRQSIPQPT